MREFKVAILGWEAPTRDGAITGSGVYLNYLSKLGKFSRSRGINVDLTFIIPGEKDRLVQEDGYKILTLKIPGFSKCRRYDGEVLYPSSKSFANRLAKDKNPIDVKKFDLILANSFAFGEFIQKAGLENIAYVSHRPEFLRIKLAKKFNIDAGHERRLMRDAELEAKAVKNSEYTITVSAACKKELAKRYRRAKIHVIPNGIDTNIFTKVKTSSNGNKRIFTYVGRSHPEKGVTLFIQSARRLIDEGEKDFELWLITDDKPRLRAMLKNLALLNCTRLWNWRRWSELPTFYSKSTFTVMPSYWESFCYVVAESLSCGTPVIASTAGALPELVGDGVGLLFHVGNEDELTKRLLEACTYTLEDVREMGRRGRGKIKRSFSKEIFLNNYLKFIDMATDGGLF